ncbi:MAG: hypothetical protein ACR2NM_01445, partial [Bythopirellula sp.]
MSRSTALGLLAFSASCWTGCSETPNPLVDAYADYQPAIAWCENTADMTPVANVSPATAASQSDSYWSFSTEGSEQGAQSPPTLTLLPTIAEPAPAAGADAEEDIVAESPTLEATASVDLGGELPVDEPPVDKPPVAGPLIALLMPPQAAPSPSIQSIVVKRTKVTAPKLARLPSDLSAIKNVEVSQPESSGIPRQVAAPVLAKLTAQERLLAVALRDSASAATGVLTDNRVNEVAKSKINHAYAMASRGGMYVARTELIEVLRMISQAKDAQHGSPKRSAALAAGLRALREAEDFEPRGTQLEAEMDIQVLCASHRTPVAGEAENANLLPRLMMDRYLRYGQLQLALSVAGEPAGSMALHALGKLSSQLGHAEPEKHRLADRHAMAYQQASLLAHNQNYLAAHELGVLLATSGHYTESQQLLQQVAT